MNRMFYWMQVMPGQVNNGCTLFFTIGKSLLGICLLTALLTTTSVEAKTFHLDELNGKPDWSATVSISGATFLSETPSWGLFEERAALFHLRSSGSASVRISVSYSGDDMVPESMEVNGQTGSTLSKTVRIPIDYTYQSPQLGGGGITAEAWGEYTDPETEETTYYKIRGDFVFNAYFYKALHVELRNSFGDFRRSVQSYKKTPYFYTHPNGVKEVKFYSEPWGDVGVQAVTEAPLFVAPTSWERTDEFGRRMFRFAAQPEPDEFNEHGLWHAPVKLRATKDGYQLETGGTASLPFSVVKNAHNVWHLGPSGSIGDIAEPVVPPATLKPGARLQVGSRTTQSAFMDVEFINGQSVRSEAGAYEGFVATIKTDGIAEGTALLWLDVKNTVQEIRDDPRRAVRMLIYKAPGNALDTALGVPDAVGWVSETPGGVVSKQLAKWGEQAYQPSSPPPKSQGMRMTRQSLSGIMEESTSPVESGMAAHADARMDFFNDGSVLIENRGDPLSLQDETGRLTVIPSGASRVVTGGNGDTVYATAALTSTRVWESPAPGAWNISPTNLTTITTPRPLISIANEHPQAFDWSTATVTLDGHDITPSLDAQLDFDFTVLALSGTLPESRRLTDGDHTLEISLNTPHGEQVVHTTTFTVAAGANTNSYAEAQTFAAGVWVSWEFEEDVASFEVYRAPNEGGAYTSLTAGAARQQPGFFDPEPLATNHYRIVGLDTEDLPVVTSAVATAWSGLDPAAPAPNAVTNFYIQSADDALEVLFDDSFSAATRWMLERSIAGSTFEALLPQEETIRSGFLDRTAPAGSNLAYRLAPISADGVITGAWATVSTILPEEPSTPVGFAVMNANTAAWLRWDAYSDRRASELRIYRNTGDGFVLLATLPIDETDYTDTAVGSDPVRYFITAASGSHESTATPTMGLACHSPASEATEIRMLESEMIVKEGIGVVTIPVIRSGNLAEPAITHFATADDGGTATADEDYVKTGGTLFFAPGQTNAMIEVEIIPDAEDEWSEYFFVDLRINGDFGPNTVPPEGQRIQITLEESDYLFFEDYQTEKTTFESDGTVAIVVERAEPSDRDISVGIIVDPDTPGDSQAGVDWVDNRPWRVFFAAGETKATLDLELIDNAEKDGKRTLNLRLDDPWEGASADSWATELALTILDDDTRPGMLRPVADGQVHKAAVGSNVLDIVLQRVGGEDGTLEVDAMVLGGSLPWGAVTVRTFPASLDEGETEALLRLELDRSGLNDSLAPFGVVVMTSSEPPYESVNVPFVFYPDGDMQSFSDFAAEAGFTAPGMLPEGDDDQDEDLNLVEVVAFGDPLSKQHQSACTVGLASGQIDWTVPLRASSQVAVFAQSTDNPAEWQDSIWDAGWWEPAENGWTGFLSVGSAQDSNAEFSRLVFLWLDADN